MKRKTTKKNGVYYLNNSGSRWVVYHNGEKEKILVEHDGEEVKRSVVEYQQFGNYVCAVYYYKGERRSTLNFKVLNK